MQKNEKVVAVDFKKHLALKGWPFFYLWDIGVVFFGLRLKCCLVFLLIVEYRFGLFCLRFPPAGNWTWSLEPFLFKCWLFLIILHGTHGTLALQYVDTT